VVVLNSQGGEQELWFNHGAVPVTFKEQCKYLGVVFTIEIIEIIWEMLCTTCLEALMVV